MLSTKYNTLIVAGWRFLISNNKYILRSEKAPF